MCKRSRRSPSAGGRRAAPPELCLGRTDPESFLRRRFVVRSLRRQAPPHLSDSSAGGHPQDSRLPRSSFETATRGARGSRPTARPHRRMALNPSLLCITAQDSCARQPPHTDHGSLVFSVPRQKIEAGAAGRRSGPPIPDRMHLMRHPPLRGATSYQVFTRVTRLPHCTCRLNRLSVRPPFMSACDPLIQAERRCKARCWDRSRWDCSLAAGRWRPVARCR